MSLRSKIILILSLVVVAYAAADNGTLRYVVSRSFRSLEELYAEDDVRTFEDRLRSEVDHLSVLCATWAASASLTDFVQGRGASAESADLTEAALDRAGLDLLYLCGPDKRVVWGHVVDPDTRAPLRLRDFPSEALSPFHPALPRGGEASASGWMMTDAGLLFVSSQVVEGADEPHTLVAGRFVDESLTHLESARGRTVFDLRPLRREELPESDQHLFDEITERQDEEQTVQTRGEDGLLHVYMPIRDIRSAPTILLSAAIEPRITQSGAKAVLFAGLTAVGAALLIFFVLLRLLQRIVLDPLSHLTEHAVEIGKTDDTHVVLGMKRGDEIGTLANEFDRMIDKLARSREQTVKTARLAGMSEIATGVLHNVGNVLNSVNVSANIVTKNAQRMAVGDIGMLTKVLSEHAGDLGTFVTSDPKGKHTLPFLTQLSGTLQQQQAELVGELRSLTARIDHISELVRSQQHYAGTKGVFEPARLDELIDTAVKICTQAHRGMDDVQIVREFEAMGRVRVDKHKLVEILVNLIQNARQAMEDAGVSPKTLTLRLFTTPDDRCCIEVQDNGIGISAENLSRVFNHGFTTKSDGHGFGLHVSANAATEMRSRLHARSEGPGKGATFVLEIPKNAEGQKRAA